MSDEIKTQESNPTSTPDSTPTSNPEVSPKATEVSSKVRLKANGKELELDHEELMRFASMGVGAHEKFQESAKMRKEAEEMLKKIETDPISYLKSKNPNFRQIAEEYLYQEIQNDEMSPDAKKAQALEQEIQRYRQKEEEEVRTKKEQEDNEILQKYSREYEQQLINALEKTSIPKDPYMVKQIVQVMSDAIEADIDLSFEEAAVLVKDSSVANIRHLLSNIENIDEYLGEEIMAKVRKSEINKVKKGNGSKPIDKAPSETKQEPKRYKGVEDMKEAILREIGSKE